jgi:biopolymer transport protein ExbD
MKRHSPLSSTNTMAGINVTPMVDVMLVLLIIFMVVTPAIVAGFQVEVPQGEHLNARTDREDRIELGIDREGDYYLNKRPIRREDALELLRAEFAGRAGDKVLFIKAHRGLKYQEILDAMGLAREVGARMVGAVTDKRPVDESRRDREVSALDYRRR